MKVLPYRESSYLLHLFTATHGLLHGVAKGMRKAQKGQQFLERGFRIECMVYVRPNRDLHTLGSIQIHEYYRATRSSLDRSAVRDAAFELALAAITVAEPHPELFGMLVHFLDSIEHLPEEAVNPFALWRFYGEFCSVMGFGIELDRCAKCANAVESGRLYLNMAQGGVECANCSRVRHESGTIGPMVRKLLKGEVSERDLADMQSSANLDRVTRLLADYCRYHFDIRGEFRTVAFLEQIR